MDLSLTVNHTMKEDSWRYRLDQSIGHLKSVNKEFTTLEPQLIHVGKIVSDEIQHIELKETNLNERFNDQIDAFKQVRICGYENIQRNNEVCGLRHLFFSSNPPFRRKHNLEYSRSHMIRTQKTQKNYLTSLSRFQRSLTM